MSTPFQTPHLFARKIALNPLRSTSNDGPTKPVLKTKKMQKCRNYIFCFHIFTQVHTTNPAHATRGRGHLVAALSFFVTSIHFSYDQPSSCYPRPRPLHYRTRDGWTYSIHTHALAISSRAVCIMPPHHRPRIDYNLSSRSLWDLYFFVLVLQCHTLTLFQNFIIDNNS